MPYARARYGTVRLKAGASLQDVLDCFPLGMDERPRPQVGASGEASLAGGAMWVRVEGGVLEYRSEGEGDRRGHQVEVFLMVVARELAEEVWVDHAFSCYGTARELRSAAAAQAGYAH